MSKYVTIYLYNSHHCVLRCVYYYLLEMNEGRASNENVYKLNVNTPEYENNWIGENKGLTSHLLASQWVSQGEYVLFSKFHVANQRRCFTKGNLDSLWNEPFLEVRRVHIMSSFHSLWFNCTVRFHRTENNSRKQLLEKINGQWN